MKIEDMKQWMEQQGVEEDVTEFVACFDQEKLDSFGNCPLVAVACMWEGWKLAKKSENKESEVLPLTKELSVGDVVILAFDAMADGYPFESYGFAIGDEVVVTDKGVGDNNSPVYDVALNRDKRRKIRVSEEELGVKNV